MICSYLTATSNIQFKVYNQYWSVCPKVESKICNLAAILFMLTRWVKLKIQLVYRASSIQHPLIALKSHDPSFY